MRGVIYAGQISLIFKKFIGWVSMSGYRGRDNDVVHIDCIVVNTFHMIVEG